MSLLDRTWHWQHTTGGVGVIVVDPVDTILCGGGRWASATTASTGSEDHLAALLAFSEEDWTDWIPDPRPTGPPAALWDRARRAADVADAAEVRTALAEGRHRYSPAGRRMLDIAILNLLAWRVAERLQRPDPRRTS